MKIRKKILSITLMLCLCFGMLSISATPAAAADPETEVSIDGGATWKDVDTLGNAVFEAYSADNSIIRLKRDIYLGSDYYAPVLALKTVTLDGAGHTIYRNDTKTPFFYVNFEGSHAILKDITLDGGAKWDDNENVSGRTDENEAINGTSYFIGVGGQGSAAAVTLDEGTILQNNHLDGIDGAAVRVEDKGTLNVKNGAVIRYNATTSGGGAIAVYDGGTVNLTGGEIYGNYAGGGGGAVFASTDTQDETVYNVNMTGGKIYDNFSGNNGGGISVFAKSRVNLAGGEIYGNTAPSGGGMLLYNNATANLNGTTLTDNESTSSKGGGIYVGSEKNGTSFPLTIGSFTLSDNKTDDIYFSGASQLGFSGASQAPVNPISVTMSTAGTFSLNWNTYFEQKNPADYFVSKMQGKSVQLDGNGELALLDTLPVYSITADSTRLDFGTVNTGYTDAPASMTVTITNTGNRTVDLNQPSAENYTIGALSKTQLAPNETAAFTVRPNVGLAAGCYDTSLTVSNNGGGSVDISLKFTVKAPAVRPTYPPIVRDTDGGDVTIRPGRPGRGDTVTVTPNPAPGFETGGVTVTDKDGNNVEVTKNEDGSFSFVQPSGKVTIAVNYVCGRGPLCPAAGFSDVDVNSWYHDGVHYVLDNGLMIGVGVDRFAPAGITTRAQIATMLYRLEGTPQVARSAGFSDVQDGQWYADAVDWAAENGIVFGYNGTTFAPNDAVTREQMAAILYRYAKYKGCDVNAVTDSGILNFEDIAEVSEYAVPAMQWACSTGLIQGIGGSRLDPAGVTERAQTAAMFLRLCEDILK